MKIPKVDQNQSGKVPEGSGHQEQWFWIGSSFKTWWNMKTWNWHRSWPR
jgi:hypothetical protein